MTWKHLSQSIKGSAHSLNGKDCEDAGTFAFFSHHDNEILIACASDGAGSALQGGWASAYIVQQAVDYVIHCLQEGKEINETVVFELLELLYNGIKTEAEDKSLPLNEYSATILCAIVDANNALFFQIGDGAIVYNDGTGFYVPVFAPQNGEFLNSTCFLIDDPSFSQLQLLQVDGLVDELALLTDGLQQLALNAVDCTVYQPFFLNLFPALRKAADSSHLEILNKRLAAYLDSAAINDRTDDDKTLLLATRLPA